MVFRVGLISTKVLLTDVSKKWFIAVYPKDLVYEYDEDKPFDLMSMGEDFVDVTCLLGIPYRVPLYVNGEITFQMADQEEEKPRHGAVEARASLVPAGTRRADSPRGWKTDGAVPCREAKQATEGE